MPEAGADASSGHPLAMRADDGMSDEELEEAIFDWARERFDRWPIEALHFNRVCLASTLCVSRKRIDRAIRALSNRRLIEAVVRTEEELAAGVPYLHRLVE